MESDKESKPERLAKEIRDLDFKNEFYDFSGFEEATSEYLKLRVKEVEPEIHSIYTVLKNNHFTEDKPFKYNDSSNSAFFIENEENDVFCITSSNANFIFMVQETGDETTSHSQKILHIRRYWDNFDPQEHSSYANEIELGGIETAIRQASYYKENFSDNIDNNVYMERPDLQWFKDKDFDLKFKKENHMTKYNSYGDARDPGYVWSQNIIRIGDMIQDIGDAFGSRVSFYTATKHALFLEGLTFMELQNEGYMDI